MYITQSFPTSDPMVFLLGETIDCSPLAPIPAFSVRIEIKPPASEATIAPGATSFVPDAPGAYQVALLNATARCLERRTAHVLGRQALELLMAPRPGPGPRRRPVRRTEEEARALLQQLVVHRYRGAASMIDVLSRGELPPDLSQRELDDFDATPPTGPGGGHVVNAPGAFAR